MGFEVLDHLKTRDFHDGIVTNLYGILQDVGFTNLDGLTLSIPVGSWGGKIGEVFQQDVEAAYSSLKPVIQDKIGWTSEEYDANIKYTATENNEVKQISNWVSFWAQKPLAA